MEEMNLPAAYGDLASLGDRILSDDLRAYLEDFRKSGRGLAGKAGEDRDSLQRYLKYNNRRHAIKSRKDATDKGIYDKIDADLRDEPVAQDVIRDDAHSLQDEKSRWIE